MSEKQYVHPYIPNSEPRIKKEMLEYLGMESSEDIFKEIPSHLRFKEKLNLPDPIMSEYKLQRHVEGLLKKNKNARNNLCFLGGGTWQHHVPAVCDTIIGRDEFLTAYVGDTYSDHGKFQSLFECSSMLGELTGFEACNTPTYDWANAIAIACRMAVRTSGKNEILLASNMSIGRKMVVKNYCLPEISVSEAAFDRVTGLLDLADLQARLTGKTAAVYFENPSYLGVIETQAAEICRIAKAAGALVIVGVDPTSLGILEAPGNYGADYAVGDLQPLGMHMSYGGGLGGFICTHDQKEFVGEYPSLLFGICETAKVGEYGFGEVFYERTSYASREKGKDFIGTCAALYGIVAGVYMALMGPQGFVEMGEGILQRVAYAKARLGKIPGVRIMFNTLSYCDFLVNFDNTGKTVADINQALLPYGIFGGKDVSRDFPVGQSALYSVTEVHDQEDIDRLINALAEICRSYSECQEGE
jgi:glycine dehydrogenase subunit 1